MPTTLVVPPVVKTDRVSQEYSILQALAAHYLAGKTLSAPVLLSLAAALSAEVKSAKELSQAEKQQLVCHIAASALQTALTVSKVGIGSPVVSQEEEVALMYVVKNVLPSTVALLTQAADGKLNLKTVEPSCWSCFSSAAIKTRGPAWDAADAFVLATEKAVVVKPVDLSGATVDLSAASVDLSGAPIDLSGVPVDLSGAPVVASS